MRDLARVLYYEVFFLFFLFFFFFFLVLRGAFRDDPNLDDDCVTSVPNENKSP